MKFGFLESNHIGCYTLDDKLEGFPDFSEKRSKRDDESIMEDTRHHMR